MCIIIQSGDAARRVIEALQTGILRGLKRNVR
jgi:hypothetical protein